MSMPLDLVVFLDGKEISRVSIPELGLTLGRAHSNDVVLSDYRVSKDHARLFFFGSSLMVKDLGSGDGTFVRGNPVREYVLAPEDEFRIGPFILRTEPREGSVHESETSKGPAEPAEGFRHMLKGLLNLTSLVGVTDVEAVLVTLLEKSVKLVGARSGFVVLASGSKLSPVLARAGAELEEPETFSRTVCQEAVDRREPIALTRVRDLARLQQIESLVDKAPGFILAIPLIDAGQPLGALYLHGSAACPPTVVQEPGVLREVSQLGGRALRSAMELKRTVKDQERWRSLFAMSTDEPDLFRAATSPRMLPVLDLVRRVSTEDISALILGESGTGKEVVARTIHRLSRRNEGPFAGLNCGAVPPDLMEAELFGHERGAFTGADKRRLGRLELAQGGTLLLDEIGDLPKDLQVKLLRVLESRTFERLGGNQSVQLDLRFVAATNRNLEQSVAKGEFREDLYYRLKVVEIRLPPLRERPEDIEALAHEMLRAANRRFRRKVYGVAPEAVAAMREYCWPGNIRELRNVIERAFILETSDRITLDSLALNLRPKSELPVKSPESLVQDDSDAPGLTEYLLQQEREYIRTILDRVHGRVTEAARILKVNRSALHRRLRQLGIEQKDHEGGPHGVF